jgi:hypothetical protein
MDIGYVMTVDVAFLVTRNFELIKIMLSVQKSQLTVDAIQLRKITHYKISSQ